MLTRPTCDEAIAVGDIALHYVQWGEQGSPMVCVHGLTANAFCFQAIADELARDHRVIAYDLRGRGDSDKPESGYSVPIHAADLGQLLDVLGLERVALIGHSLGALIALYFAAHNPQRVSRLVLVDAGAPLLWKTVEEQPAWLTASINRLGTPVASYKEYVEHLKQAPFLDPYWNEYVDTYFAHDVYQHPDGSVTSKALREGILEEQQNFHEARSEEQWAQVQAPTLLLRAGQGMFSEDDQLLSEEAAAAIQRGIMDCRYINYPALNHYTIIFGVEEGPARAIRQFVTGDGAR